MKSCLSLPLLVSLALPVLGADFEKTVGDLVPRLADANVEARYPAQMELQDLASNASRPGNAAEREALGRVLAARAADAAVPQPARVWIVRQLEYMGGEEAVPALTPLLASDDLELRECARRALEKNPAPAASASLRAALAKGGDARWRIGLINALGQRADPEAVRTIQPALGDPATAPTAAQALGRIATPEAVQALRPVLRSLPAAADALVEAANRQRARGNASAAKPLYEEVYGQAPAASARAAALSALASLDPSGSVPRIQDALTGNDPALRHAAIAAAAAAGHTLMPTLVKLLPKLGPVAQVQVLGVLDASAEPAVIAAAADSNPEVRRAALQQLGRIGSVASVPLLLQAAAGDPGSGKAEAESALATLRGAGVVAALQQAATTGEPKPRAAALQALTVREAREALPTFLRCAADPDATVRRAALTGLGRLGGDAEIVPVGRLALSSKADDAVNALEAIAARSQNRAAAARGLLDLAAGNEASLLPLLNTLGLLGGAESLQVMTRLLPGPHAEAALRALGNWPSLDAAKPLLKVAADTAAPAKQHQLALQATARLVSTVEDAPLADRTEAALGTLAAARGPEEQKLALSAAGTVPSPKVAAALKPLLTDPALRAEAALAGVALAEQLARTDAAAAADLARAILAIKPDRDVGRRANALAKP